MQFRRTMMLTLGASLLLAGIASFFAADRAAAEVKRAMMSPKLAGSLRTSDVGDPDTVWIGHVQSPSGLPGTPGGYGPYKIGRGTRLHAGAARGARQSGRRLHVADPDRVRIADIGGPKRGGLVVVHRYRDLDVSGRQVDESGRSCEQERAQGECHRATKLHLRTSIFLRDP